MDTSCTHDGAAIELVIALLAIGLTIYAVNNWMGGTSERPNTKDVQLFENFARLFSDNNLIRFYKEHDFLASFDHQYLEPLNEFIAWDNAAYQFVNHDMEKARQELYTLALALGLAIANNTVPNHVGQALPDWVKRDAKEINELASIFVEHHENFIRMGRKKL